MIATKLLTAIDAGLIADGGNTFRRLQGEAMRAATDPFRDDEDNYRTHLGASRIAQECSRMLWYEFRWVDKAPYNPKMLRLWNRGHLEEPRFLALLRMVGVQVWDTNPDTGKQWRITALGGHFGGSSDGVALGIPDMPETPVLLEFKTHNDNSFKNLTQKGVQDSKPEHYGQMMTYMKELRLEWGLYMAVNKNNDEIHAELVPYNNVFAEHYVGRANYILSAPQPPVRIGSTPSWKACKFCDMKAVCFSGKPVAENCRTCRFSRIVNGGWECWNDVVSNGQADCVRLSKQEQMAGCSHYEKMDGLR